MLGKRLTPLQPDHIQIQDPFWKQYMELVRQNVIPYQWDALNDRIDNAAPSHCIANFRIAAGLEKGEFHGFVFQDSDLYKWLEAVAWSLMWHPDERLERTADEAIDLIASVQQPDGYLDTYYIINGLDQRFTNLMDCHELYCLGHMLEAAVAYYKSTGKDKFLKVASRFADCVYEHFGHGPGKIPGYPGHEVAEMALVELYRITKDPRHLELAKYFIDERGQRPLFFDEEEKRNGNTCHWNDTYFGKQYYQAGRPVREQTFAQGHAVRAVYLYSGMTEVAYETGDAQLFEACETLWNNITTRQMYITGAIGSTEHGEAFTFDYDLPNDTIYGETCAAIGLIFFARRMFEITGDSRYTDVMEQALYNAVISGMSLDGTSFFYVNPLEVNPESSLKDYTKKHVKPVRQKWFGCACCPPNIARLLSSIGGYAYSQSDETLYMNLFIGGDIEAELGGATRKFHVETGYPWNGKVKVTVEGAGCFGIAIRIPGWCHDYTLIVAGEPVFIRPVGGYVMFNRKWAEGDEILLKMDMPVSLVEANPLVREDVGKLAVTRGPLVYCLEETDNGKVLQDLLLSGDPDFEETFEKELLKGVVTLKAQGKKISRRGWDGTTLYRTYRGDKYEDHPLKFVPYYSWANRGEGEMMVWIRHE